MHAIVVKVTVNEFDAARKTLHEQVVPRVKQAPGFVAGYWLAPEDGQGLSVLVFESEDAAKGFAGQIQSPPGGEVTIDSVDLREVVAHA